MASLTPTSYVVLGLLELAGPGTPYELKARVARSVGNFWSIPHSQLYAEPDRLLTRGLVDLQREDTGRRRKIYAINDAGREALRAFTADPPDGVGELRDPALLALFLGADPKLVSARYLPGHEAKLAEYEQLAAAADAADLPPGAPRGPRLALEVGLRYERGFVAFLREL